MVKNFISAKDARTQTETTQKPLNVLFKHIKERAEWGLCQFDHCVIENDPQVVINIIKTLKNAGYSVEERTDDDGRTIDLHISW